MTDTRARHGDDDDGVRLHALLDGELDAAARATLDQHLAACAVCRARLADLETLRRAAQALERYVPPARLWPQVARAIGRADHPRTVAAPRSNLPDALAAAVALVLMVSALWWVGAGLSAPVAERMARAGEPAAALDGVVDEDLRLVEARYADTIAALESVVTLSADAGLDGSQSARALDPRAGGDAVTLLRTSIADVDDAIGESRSALVDEPSNEVARSSLIDALGQKVALLHETVALLDDLRADDEVRQTTSAERTITP